MIMVRATNWLYMIMVKGGYLVVYDYGKGLLTGCGLHCFLPFLTSQSNVTFLFLFQFCLFVCLCVVIMLSSGGLYIKCELRSAGHLGFQTLGCAVHYTYLNMLCIVAIVDCILVRHVAHFTK